jgi:hypothetical protein
MIDGPFSGTGWLSLGETEHLTGAERIGKAEWHFNSRHTAVLAGRHSTFLCHRVPGCWQTYLNIQKSRLQIRCGFCHYYINRNHQDW